jgi:diaminopimelate epimerase
MRSAVPFVKATACGNDFLIIDGIHAPAEMAAFTRTICDRHRGIGADGVEWLFPASDADIHARLFNADGSEAEISGNGTRCVAAYIASEQPKDKIAVSTGAGVKACMLIARSELSFEFEIAMGRPQVGDEFAIKLSSHPVRGVPVSMGNPHFVSFVNSFTAGWQAEAATIQMQPQFENGINVEFVTVRDKAHIEIRLFERGVGETQSSGTGSCAAAVAAIATARAESPVRVQAPGGIQTVRWAEEVYLRGSAQMVGRGEFFL